MFNRFQKPPESKPPYLTYPQHYKQTTRLALGNKCDLSLIHAAVDGLKVNLVYQWKTILSNSEADRLDTRARAYIACAIYDAAITAGLSCRPGSPHGQRPSWHIGGERMSLSLVHARFDVSDKTCFMQIGPCMLMMGGPQPGGNNNKRLLTGFQAQFKEIKV